MFRTNLLPRIELARSFLSQSKLFHRDPTEQFNRYWDRCKYIVIDSQPFTINHGDCTDRGVELGAHFPSRSRLSLNESGLPSRVDRREAEDYLVEAIHRGLDCVRLCVVTQKKRRIVDHDQRWVFRFRRSSQLLRSSCDEVPRTISNFDTSFTESAPSNFCKFFPLQSLGSVLLNFLHFRDDLVVAT